MCDCSLLLHQVLEQLKETSADILQGRPLRIVVKGLKYMNDDPSKIHVLYFDVADTEGEGSSKIAGVKELRQFSEEVVGAFQSEGLSSPGDDRSSFDTTFLLLCIKAESLLQQAVALLQF